jgi:hypothetical protein
MKQSRIVGNVTPKRVEPCGECETAEVRRISSVSKKIHGFCRRLVTRPLGTDPDRDQAIRNGWSSSQQTAWDGVAPTHG